MTNEARSGRCRPRPRTGMPCPSTRSPRSAATPLVMRPHGYAAHIDARHRSAPIILVTQEAVHGCRDQVIQALLDAPPAQPGTTVDYGANGAFLSMRWRPLPAITATKHSHLSRRV